MIHKVQFADNVEPVWRDALEHSTYTFPFLTYDWHKTWHDCFATTPAIFVDEAHHIVIPLEIENTTAHFSGGEEIADYLDAIGPEKAKVEAWKEVIATLQSQGITLLRLRNVPEHSETLHYFGTLAGAAVGREDTTPIVTLPETFETYVSQMERKERHELKRKIKKFEQTHPGITVSVSAGHQTDIPTLMRLMHIDHNKHEFLTPQMQQFFHSLPKTVGEDLVQLNLSHLNQTIATVIGFRTQHELLLYNSGYIREYAGAGLYLKAKTIEWAIDQKISRINFLQGNEHYKYELGGKDTFVHRIELPLILRA